MSSYFLHLSYDLCGNKRGMLPRRKSISTGSMMDVDRPRLRIWLDCEKRGMGLHVWR